MEEEFLTRLINSTDDFDDDTNLVDDDEEEKAEDETEEDADADADTDDDALTEGETEE